MQQALGYAEILGVPSAFSSNGDAFASHNKVAAIGEDIETEFPLEKFPSPKELWERYKKLHNISDKEEDLVLQPYHTDGSGKEPRYYQVEAINQHHRSCRKRPKKNSFGHGNRHGQNIHYISNHLAFVESQKLLKEFCFLVDRNILARPNTGKRLQALWFGNDQNQKPKN